MPGIAPGAFAIRAGGLMAASDRFTIDIEGSGGHAAMPHNTIDPITVAAHIVTALQTIVSRTLNPVHPAVISVASIHAGDAFNVIPRTARLLGTARSLDESVRDLLEERIGTVAAGIAAALGASVSYDYHRGYPVTINSERETAYAAQVARDVAGTDRVDDNTDPTMGGEDFSYMLQARPGAFIFLGNGDSAGLHSDGYDFNDDIIPTGVSYLVRLVEQAADAA
jgi:hippurate hydrolase